MGRWLLVVLFSQAHVPDASVHDKVFKPYEIPIWGQRVANAKSLRIAWKDTVADQQPRIVTGEELAELKTYFSSVFPFYASACWYHREAVLVLNDGTTVGLCFGCGLADIGDDVPYFFNETPKEVRAYFERLLGPRPLDALQAREDEIEKRELLKENQPRKKVKP